MRNSIDQSQFIVITGATSGIGLATAKLVADSTNYNVIVTKRPGTKPAFSSEKVIWVDLDLLDPNSITTAAGEIITLSSGNVYCLFNNAGYGLQLAMEDVTHKSLSDQLHVNFIAPVQLTNLLLPALRNIPYSKLIFNSSVLGFIAIPFRGPYCASKFALEAAADAYRMELKHTNTSVVLIEPGPIKANFKQSSLKHLMENQQSLQESRLSYDALLKRLSQDYSPSTLTSENVADVVLKIINTKSPNTRYRITRSTKIAFLLRLLPDFLKDFIMSSTEKVIIKNNHLL